MNLTSPCAKRRLLVRFTGDENAVKSALPGCEIRVSGEEKAVMTAEAPADELEKTLNTLSASVSLGAPLYVL